MKRKKRKPLKLLHVPVVHSDAHYADSAATRQRIASEQAEMLAEAIRQCGPGATAYARWDIHDRSLPGQPLCRVIYCCRRPEHAWQPGHAFEGSDERLATGGTTVKGIEFFPFRYEVRFHFIADAENLYAPKSAEELKLAQEKKRLKALAENEKRIAAEREWQRRNVPPNLFAEYEAEGT